MAAGIAFSRTGAPAREDDYPRGSFLRGLGCSTGLHLAVVAALLAGFDRLAAPRPMTVAPAILVNLVTLADVTGGPDADLRAAIPQQRAAEKGTSPQAIPAPQSPSVPHAPRPSSDSRATTGPASSETLPRDDLDARLERLAQLHQPAPALPPAPRDQDGSGLSNRDAFAGKAGRDATYRVQDFLRAQIERRWNVDVAALKADRNRAAIHLLIDPDGTVRRAEIVPDPASRNDPAAEDFARRARNAAILSSPLTLLPGSYDIAKDIVIEFDVRRLIR
jgi:hypothetical protein